MNQHDIAREFAQQRKPKGKAGNVFYRGPVIYSYGDHFPMAYVRGARAFVNSDRYSVSTSRQQSRTQAALIDAGYTLTAVNTSELQALISQGGKP